MSPIAYKHMVAHWSGIFKETLKCISGLPLNASMNLRKEESADKPGSV